MVGHVIHAAFFVAVRRYSVPNWFLTLEINILIENTRVFNLFYHINNFMWSHTKFYVVKKLKNTEINEIFYHIKFT